MKKTILLLAIVFIIGIGYAFYINSVNNVTTVKLNEEIILKKNDKIKLEDEEVYVTLKKFINSPPPEGATSIWSGLAVIYELEINGEIHKTNDVGNIDGIENLQYGVDIVESDYKTFAKLKLVENN